MTRALAPMWIALPLLVGQVAAQEAPSSPFKPRGQARPDARPGTVTMSDSGTYKGLICTTRDKSFRIYDTADKAYRDIPLAALKEILIAVEKEGMEKEWRWKEGGSDVKVDTGKSYPWQQYLVTVVLSNGQKIEGHLSSTPIYVEVRGKQVKLLIQQKNKGELGQKLSDLIYIKKIEFDEPKEDTK